MIYWYWYLLAASALSLAGYISLDIVPTAALAAAAHLARRFTARRGPVWGRTAFALVSAAGLALLWRQSYLPPVTALIDLARSAATMPSPQYFLTFAWQALSFSMLAAGAAGFAAAFYVSKKAPRLLAWAAYSAILLAWALRDGGTPAPEAEGEALAFFRAESARASAIPSPAPGARPFDIIILHVCSLSWQDIRDSRSDLVPFLSRFDYVFTGFNSVSAYSDPAALRLLKSSCGQLPQGSLYSVSRPECYLLDRLSAAGYTKWTALSHTGAFGGFSENLRKYGHAAPPMRLPPLRPAYKMFDGSDVYADDEVLRAFWRERIKSGGQRAVLYYNTAALHSGTRRPGALRLPDDPRAYGERLSDLTARLEKFIGELESSGRRAVVIFVPEHGAALSGGRMQAKAVRDIPLPPIVGVPVAVKLVGTSRTGRHAPAVIAKPASYHALAWLIAEFLERDPFGPGARPPDIIAREIPGTDFYSENRNAAVMASPPGFAFKCVWKDNGAWSSLPSSEGPRPGAVPPAAAFVAGAAASKSALSPEKRETAGTPRRIRLGR